MLSVEQKNEKKEHMLEKCFELFVKRGLENTSVNDLADYCQTYKAALYNFFASKDEIVLESAKMYMTNLDDMFYKEFLNPQPSLIDALKHGFKLIACEEKNLRYIYQVISSPKYGDICRDGLAELYTKYLNYSDIFARIYKVDSDEFRVYFLLFIGAVQDYCLWGNKALVQEKLAYIYGKTALL